MTLTPEQAAEIAALRDLRADTRRPTVPALEAMLYEAIPVLDHGFVRVIDYMGDDAAIVQAARVPAPVRAVFRSVHHGGTTEVDWEPKARQAKLVPYWERRHV